MKKKTAEDVKFAYSKATMDLKNKYNQEIDAVIKQLENIKIKGNKFDVKELQNLKTNLSRVNSLSNRKHVEKAYDEFYNSVTLDLQERVEQIADEKE